MSGTGSLRTRWLGRVAYAEALAVQERLVADRRAGTARSEDG